jgi:hypothetical protein
MNPYHAPYRQPQLTTCGQPVCGRLRCSERVVAEPTPHYQRYPEALPAGPSPLPMHDPISKSAAVTGAVANCLVAIPFIGGIFGIIFGLIAVRRARRGRLAVESSAHGLRGKGAYVAGKILGWSAFGLGIFMTNYYLLLLVVIAANS